MKSRHISYAISRCNLVPSIVLSFVLLCNSLCDSILSKDPDTASQLRTRTISLANPSFEELKLTDGSEFSYSIPGWEKNSGQATVKNWTDESFYAANDEYGRLSVIPDGSNTLLLHKAKSDLEQKVTIWLKRNSILQLSFSYSAPLKLPGTNFTAGIYSDNAALVERQLNSHHMDGKFHRVLLSSPVVNANDDSIVRLRIRFSSDSQPGQVAIDDVMLQVVEPEADLTQAATAATSFKEGMLRLKEKDYARAAQLFNNCLADDKYRAAAMYNIACVYALQSKKEQAIESLEAALGCGYRDLNNLRKDSDLTNIRGLKQFESIERQMQRLRKGASALAQRVLFPNQPARSWSDITGKFKIVAKPVELDHGTLVLLGENDVIRKVPLSQLSAEDSEHVKDLVSDYILKRINSLGSANLNDLKFLRKPITIHWLQSKKEVASTGKITEVVDEDNVKFTLIRPPTGTKVLNYTIPIERIKGISVPSPSEKVLNVEPNTLALYARPSGEVTWAWKSNKPKKTEAEVLLGGLFGAVADWSAKQKQATPFGIVGKFRRVANFNDARLKIAQQEGYPIVEKNRSISADQLEMLKLAIARINKEDGHLVLVHEHGGGVFIVNSRDANMIESPEVKSFVQKSTWIQLYNREAKDFYVRIQRAEDGYFLHYRNLGIPFVLPMTEVLGIEVDGRLLYGERTTAAQRILVRENYLNYRTASFIECLEGFMMAEEIAGDIKEVAAVTARNFINSLGESDTTSTVVTSTPSTKQRTQSKSNSVPNISGKILIKSGSGAAKPAGKNIELELSIGQGPLAILLPIKTFTNQFGEFDFNSSRFDGGHTSFDIYINNRKVWSGRITEDTNMELTVDPSILVR